MTDLDRGLFHGLSDEEFKKVKQDLLLTGRTVILMHSDRGERIDPWDFYVNPSDDKGGAA